MKSVVIHTQKKETSRVICRKGVLRSALPEELKSYGEVFVFTDENVLKLYAKKIKKYLGEVPVWAMPAGEENKTPQTLFALLGTMASAGLHRNACLVCLGGGVVGDIGGLAASLYMRGIACIQVPTTLLSQVDSSVGGKTAVDFMGVKNLVGAFFQPKKVFADPAFFATLPPREIRCGLGEIVKHGALDADIFDALVQNADRLTDLEFLAGIVPKNIAFKASVVRADATEQGLRKCLNLGHTTAHAFELLDGKLSHGEYVLVGMMFEAELAKKFADGDGEYLTLLQQLCLKVLGGMPSLPDAEEAARFAMLDKKNTQKGSVVLTVPVRKGEWRLLEMEGDRYSAQLKEIGRTLC